MNSNNYPWIRQPWNFYRFESKSIAIRKRWNELKSNRLYVVWYNNCGLLVCFFFVEGGLKLFVSFLLLLRATILLPVVLLFSCSCCYIVWFIGSIYFISNRIINKYGWTKCSALSNPWNTQTSNIPILFILIF